LGSECCHTPKTASRSSPWASLHPRGWARAGAGFPLFEGWLFPFLGRTASSWLVSRDDRLSRQLHFGFHVCRDGGCNTGHKEDPVPVYVIFFAYKPPVGAQN